MTFVFMAGKRLDIRTIEEIRRGSIKAFELLFNEYFPVVKSFALGFLKSEAEAEDVTQVVFTKLWMYRDRLSTEKSLNNYIFTVTRNEVNDYFRNKHYFSNFCTSYVSSPRPGFYEMDSDYDIKEIQEILDETISAMPEQRKKIFIMSRRQFLSNDEIAEKLGLSKRTVEKHISLALAAIRSRLGDFFLWLLIFLVA